MRAPPLARMAAVAAPRPDAEPVTIAHKPSPDIRISLLCFSLTRSRAIYHIAHENTCKPAKLRPPELVIPSRGFMPSPQGRPRTSALVMAVAFPHHAAQETTASRLR